MSGLPAAFDQIIERDFPADFLSLDPADLTTFGRDWTRVFEPRPCAVAARQGSARRLGPR
jgi:hypothetical protein